MIYLLLLFILTTIVIVTLIIILIFITIVIVVMMRSIKITLMIIFLLKCLHDLQHGDWWLLPSACGFNASMCCGGYLMPGAQTQSPGGSVLSHHRACCSTVLAGRGCMHMQMCAHHM